MIVYFSMSEKIHYGYSLEVPRQGALNEYLQVCLYLQVSLHGEIKKMSGEPYNIELYSEKCFISSGKHYIIIIA